MSRLLGVRCAFPERYYTQNELAQGLLAMVGEGKAKLDTERVRKLFSAVQVQGRHLVLPLGRYRELIGLEDRNREWLQAAVPLAETAVVRALADAGLAAGDVQLFASSTVTGIAVPSLEARLMNRLKFASDCRRMPLFGLGCVAGAAGIARVHDYLQGHPTHAALLLCVELCSLTFQPRDESIANVIACGLFGDGAACVVMVGEQHPLASRAKSSIEGTRSVLFPNTERVMGWDVVDTGFRIVLEGSVPELARTALAGSVRSFVAGQGLSTRDVVRWVAHPGGPAVIDAMEGGLELAPGRLDHSRDCLGRIGNLSSVSVLVILEESLAHDHRPGPGLLLAMGPGFCAELVLLQC
jgi:alkylresorcinol/alkylpyrone synthase